MFHKSGNVLDSEWDFIITIQYNCLCALRHKWIRGAKKNIHSSQHSLIYKQSEAELLAYDRRQAKMFSFTHSLLPMHPFWDNEQITGTHILKRKTKITDVQLSSIFICTLMQQILKKWSICTIYSCSNFTLEFTMILFSISIERNINIRKVEWSWE